MDHRAAFMGIRLLVAYILSEPRSVAGRYDRVQRRDLPGSMNGLKLAAAIRDRWAPIQIIITSGHFRLGDRDIPVRTVFFPKQYDHQQVVAALHGISGSM
ncbi:hypothetical protein CO657_30980 (plasmid) [Rhizobium acidisoli]|uniref:Response regulatory domain-containing protein n=1 Tax=Rhizobium acidisoli TaxID=1538158 RepID=A0AAE5WTI6_9HYPH|nr:hypothetical protein [Rhizobium acidisoli]QAS82238.1 hypothetical protein CO657_30980 [Rhizobium acidisoli]